MSGQLSDGVWWNQLGWRPPIRRNVYLVDDGEVTLVDAGMPWDAGPLRRWIETLGYGLDALDRVLVTHYDLDHVGSLGRLVADHEVPVYMGATDLALASGEYTPSVFHHKGAFHRVLRRLFPLSADLDLRSLEDGAPIGGFVAYDAPGHNPGHTVYVNESVDAAFLGDLVWGDGGALTTPVWLDSYDLDRLEDSVHELASRLPPFELACMGHGRPIRTGGDDALAALSASL